MGAAARKFRQMVVAEDADDECLVFAFYPEVPVDDDADDWSSFAPEDDALAHTVAPEECWPLWWCDECDTRNEGPRYTCAMCGTVRPDADTLS